MMGTRQGCRSRTSPARKRRPSHAAIVAYLALFVALGGVSWAALKLPKNSVGPKQIARAAVGTSEVKDGALQAADFGETPTWQNVPLNTASFVAGNTGLKCYRDALGIVHWRGSAEAIGTVMAGATVSNSIPSECRTSEAGRGVVATVEGISPVARGVAIVYVDGSKMRVEYIEGGNSLSATNFDTLDFLGLSYAAN